MEPATNFLLYLRHMTYRRLQVYFFLAVSAVAVLLSFLVFRPYLGLMVFSGVLAVLMYPVYERLLGYYRNQATLASMSTVMLTLIVVLLPLLFFVAALVTEAVGLFDRVRGQISFAAVEGTLSRILGPEQAHLVAVSAGEAVRDVASYVQPVVSTLTSNVVSVFSNTFSFVLGFFLVLMGMYYLLKDGKALKKEILDLSPLTDDDDSIIFSRVRNAVEAVAYGQFVVSLIKGTVGGVAFLLLGLSGPVFWGTMIALSNFLPVIGTGLVTIPFVVYLFAIGEFWSAVILGIVSVLIIGLVDNFLTPQLLKGRIRIHPMLILLSILGGLSLFGALGLFFGPIILSVTVALIDIYKKEFRASIEKIEKI